METITFKVGGMTCGGCVNSVRKVVSAVSGVNTVDVSLEKAQAVIAFDPAKTGAAALKSAIEDAGFDAS